MHLAYCTNIHRGEDWAETFRGLDAYTLQVRSEVCAADKPYAIGLRLSQRAAMELSEPQTLAAFQRWLEVNNCYVFTINGFPYGDFHGTRVKQQVFAPDWQTVERLEYTKTLFDLLVKLVPKGIAGSVSTVPGSLKAFIKNEGEVAAIQDNLIACGNYIADLCERHDVDLHLGLEPEPRGLIESTPETLDFFAVLFDKATDKGAMQKTVGVNYDTCHMAIQYEDARESLDRLTQAGIRMSKLHLSSALKALPNAQNLQTLGKFVDPVYLHQVVARRRDGLMDRSYDLDEALAWSSEQIAAHDEWRVHFHVPLHAPPFSGLSTTVDHLEDALEWLKANPGKCEHLEFETYTWEVLPDSLKSTDVVEQLCAEYDWCLDRLAWAIDGGAA